jgi:demethylmenaquinone methyltransferase/2-methoxy-6-polyprenyl-1,4-benzoquinol methylase
MRAMTATLTPPPSVDKSSDRIQRMFGQIAPRYDRINHLLSFSVDRYWRWRTVRAVPPEGPAPILDLCTGTGDLALAYYRAAAGRSDVAQAEVFGADFCHEMLAIAEEKKRRAGIGFGLTFIEADAQSLPFASDHFQIVSVAFGLRNIQNTDLALREMARVLIPGGRLAVLEFSMPRRQPLKSLYGWYFRRVLPKLGQLLAKGGQAAYDYLPASVGQFPSYQALADRMQAAGLRQVAFHPLTFGIATLYVGLK